MFLVILKFANACLCSGHNFCCIQKKLSYKSIYKKVLMPWPFFHLIENCISQQITYFIFIQKQTLPFLQSIKFLDAHPLCISVIAGLIRVH